MAIKRVKETEKVTIGVLRTALQSWLTPELSNLSDRLTHVEARLDGIDKRLDGIDKRLDAMEMRVASLEKQVEGQGKRIDSIEKRMEESITSFRNEMRSEFATVHGEIRHLQQITDMRGRLASVEAKLAAQHG